MRKTLEHVISDTDIHAEQDADGSLTDPVLQS